MADTTPIKEKSTQGAERQAKRAEIIRQVAVWMPAIIVVLVIAYAAVAWFMLFRPKIAPLMTGGQYDLTKLEERIVADEAYIKKVGTSLSSYQKIPKANRDKLKNVVPEDVRFPSLMAQLESLAEESGMQLTTIDAVVGEAGDLADGRIPIRVTATFDAGTYQDFKSLLVDIQRSERLFDIQQFQYSSEMTSYMLIMNAYALSAS